ncbi:MmcQ/YjbR family DNA-binding protein [Streptomyces griseorubiginosus]|uniref:MmcQ/YjbR family DNA-binding protein n=1 Tax=Streptomyces griseorubiginosus TaxID=67304 RepID=UPI0036F154E6
MTCPAGTVTYRAYEPSYERPIPPIIVAACCPGRVFKVRGKVFMLMTEVPGRPVVILKADPDEADALREQSSNITPGYHMNKKHWITLEGGEDVDRELVRELVSDSYRLVVAHLPKAERPVDPHTYGTGPWPVR